MSRQIREMPVKLVRLARVAAGTVGLLGGIASPALGATYSGAISHRAPAPHTTKNPHDRAVDVRRITATFDNATGFFTVTVTFAKAPTAATRARVYLGFAWADITSSGQCHSPTGPYMAVDTKGQGVSGLYWHSCQPPAPPGPFQVHGQRSGRTITASVIDPALIGAVPTTFNQTRVSWRTIPFDYVPPFPMTEDAPQGS
jgi:hypothetical protein